MPTGNIDEAPPPPPAPPPVSGRSFRLPADYYSAPLSEVRPIFPSWVPYGCGAASAVFLVLLFASGSILSGPKFAELLDFVLGTSLGELRPMMQNDVTPDQKEQFEAEMKTLRERLRNGEVPAARIQPFLKLMQNAIVDEKVTGDELERLTRAAHDAAKPEPKKP